MNTSAPIQISADSPLSTCLYIDGQWIESVKGARLPVINPATEQVIIEVARGSGADVEIAVRAARNAFETWSNSTIEYRQDLLGKIHSLMMERKEQLAQTLSQEMGSAITFARTMHVPLAAEHVRVASEVLSDFKFRKIEAGTAVVKEPIGVCGLITPWNWPLYQITAKVAPALAAGCTIVLKPSELSPMSALLFAQIVHDAGVPPGVFNLVNGAGSEVGAAMAEHPGIDMMSITGSNRAGAEVTRAAANTFKRVTLELGGKSPNILLPDADFESAVAKGVLAAFRNVGQSCSAPTRMLVPRDRLTEVESLAAATARSIVVGAPEDEETVLGPIANEAQYIRVRAFINIGMGEGAKLLCGGLERNRQWRKGFFIAPTIFSEVRADMRIAQEEIFGPVLCLIAYDSVDEAVEIANNTKYGLGAHVQGDDIEQARRVASRIRSGQVHINYPAWDPRAPFGGYKHSGNGREYGVYGLEEYLETKAIIGFE